MSRDSLLSSAYLLTVHDVVAIYTKKVAPEIKAHIFCLAPMAMDEEEEEEVEPHNVCVTMIRGGLYFLSCDKHGTLQIPRGQKCFINAFTPCCK